MRLPSFDKYGRRWYGPAGRRVVENKNHCIVELWPTKRPGGPRQCNHPRGHGRYGVFCKQHKHLGGSDADRS